MKAIPCSKMPKKEKKGKKKKKRVCCPLIEPHKPAPMRTERHENLSAHMSKMTSIRALESNVSYRRSSTNHFFKKLLYWMVPVKHQSQLQWTEEVTWVRCLLGSIVGCKVQVSSETDQRTELGQKEMLFFFFCPLQLCIKGFPESLSHCWYWDWRFARPIVLPTSFYSVLASLCWSIKEELHSFL